MTTPVADPALLEERAEDLYEHAPCGYLSTLPDGTIVKVNATLLAWTGYRRDALVGRRFQDLLSAGGRIFYETHYAPLLIMQGTVREIATDLVCADGRSLPVLVNSVVRTDEEGTPLVVRTTVFDATERRRYEEELLLARRRAEDAEASARLLARTLQESFLPSELPVIPGLDVAAAYRPAGRGNDVGGDFYDVFSTGRGEWAFVLGDVCGKGAEAARVTALARYTVRTAAMRTRRPKLVLGTLNEALVRQAVDRYCTAVYARARGGPGGVRLTVAAGGHLLPLRVTAAGDVSTLGRSGQLLGVLVTPDLYDTTVELSPGDVVVFFTDGITEGRRADGELFGDDRLHALVAATRGQTADAIVAAVVGAVVDFQADEPRDDIAVVVVKVPEEPAGR